MKKILCSFLFVVNLLTAQTKVDLSKQIKTLSTAVPTVFVNIPTVGLVLAKLDPSLVLAPDSSGNYTLISIPSQPQPPQVIPVLVVNTDNFKQTSPNLLSVFSTTKKVNGGKNNLEVYRNGILQTEVEDFVSVFNPGDGTVTVTFPNISSEGDIVKLRYF